jgi:uncharacterized membrane protein required for colicin V production
MLIHLIKSINWIDAALAVLFIRIIFVGVQNGFISEFFKCLGVVVAIFISLHYYSVLAAWMAQKTHFAWGYWDLLMFVDLWAAVIFFFKLVRDGMALLFKAETIHQGFDKYTGGILAVGHGILVCSLTIFFILLIHFGPLTRMTLHSFSFKIAGRVDVSIYSYLYNHLIDKLFAGEQYNTAAALVFHPA